MTNMEFSKKV